MNMIFPWVAGCFLLVGVGIAQVSRPTSDKAAPVAQRVNVTAGIVSAQAAKTATGRVALTVQTKVAPGEMKLLDAAGTEVPLTASADGTLRADVEARRAYVLTPRTVERRPLSKEGVQFPARYVTIASLEVETRGPSTKSAVIPRPGAVLNLGGLFLRASAVPLTWDENVKAYATELMVGYVRRWRGATAGGAENGDFFRGGPQCSDRGGYGHD